MIVEFDAYVADPLAVLPWLPRFISIDMTPCRWYLASRLAYQRTVDAILCLNGTKSAVTGCFLVDIVQNSGTTDCSRGPESAVPRMVKGFQGGILAKWVAWCNCMGSIHCGIFELKMSGQMICQNAKRQSRLA